MSSSKTQKSHKLTAGEFYSPVIEQRRTADFTLSELRHATPHKFPRHTHEAAYFSLLLEGSYAEFLGRRSVYHQPLTIAWHPAAVTHYDEVGPVGAHFFTVEVKPPLIKRLSEFAAVPDDFCTSQSDLSRLGLRLYREFKAGDDASLLAIEGLLLEMLAGAARVRPEDGSAHSPPVWLKRVVDRLEAEFAENPSLTELAREAGVHPVHLSATFRRFQHATIGEYIHRQRVSHAARMLLLDKEIPLTEIAAACGFSDQSHLTRIFKRLTGLPPGEFRRTLTAR